MFGIDWLTAALLKKLAGPLLIVGVFVGGWGSGISWEHRGPQKFPLSMLGKSLAAQRDELKNSIPTLEAAARLAGAKAQAIADKPAFDRWSARVDKCDADRTSERNTAALAISKAEAFLSVQTSSAYQLGRATCEVPHEVSPSSPGAQPVSSGVRDEATGPSFSDLFSAGAYRPGDGVPAGSEGRPPG
jgi:hypothetical protein